MKICLLSSTFFPSVGGVEIGIHNIACELILMGHKVVVVAPHSARQWAAKNELTYEVVFLPPKFFALCRYYDKSIVAWFFRKYFEMLHKRLNVDIWHVTMSYPAGIAFAGFANEHHVPYLVRSAGVDVQVLPDRGYGVRLDRRVNSIIQQHFSTIKNHAAASAILKKIYRELGASSKIHDVKNGVTLSRFHTIRDKPKPLNSQKITRFISVGRNEPKKNYRQLIEIFCELLNYRKDIHLTLIGVKCESLSQYIPNRFYENVTLIDPSIKKLEPNDVLQIPNEIVCAEYKKADVFLMPSLMESFGIVVIEAFAAGLPVVAFDIDGVNELVIQGQNGLLVQVGNSKGFQDAINELCSDQVRTTFSKSALNTAQQYDWKIVVQEYVEIYREIISEKKDIIHK